MIVTLHISMANRHKQLDPNIRIQVESLPRTHTVLRVKGNQLLLAGVHTWSRDGLRVFPERHYFLHISDVVPVCYDCVTFNDRVLQTYPDADLRYVMRVQKYDEDGWPMVLVSDAIKAANSFEPELFTCPIQSNLVPIKPACVRFCKTYS